MATTNKSTKATTKARTGTTTRGTTQTARSGTGGGGGQTAPLGIPAGSVPMGSTGAGRGGTTAFNVQQARSYFPQINFACQEMIAAISALQTTGNQGQAWGNEYSLLRAWNNLIALGEQLHVQQSQLVNV